MYAYIHMRTHTRTPAHTRTRVGASAHPCTHTRAHTRTHTRASHPHIMRAQRTRTQRNNYPNIEHP